MSGMDVLWIPDHFGGWIPEKLIEGFSSIIWTERFQEPGEFQFKTPYVRDILNALPELSFVTLRDSREVMIVENRSIGTDSDGKPELTVTGRSLDAILENRFLTVHPEQYGKTHVMAQWYTLDEVTAVMIWNAVNNDTGVNVTHNYQPTGSWFTAAYSTYPAFYDVAVANSCNKSKVPGGRQRRWIRSQKVSDRVLDFLVRGNLGLRIMRPTNTNKNLMWVSTGDTNIGTYNEANYASDPRLVFDIYNGINRSMGTRPIVISYDAGHIESPEYLYSSKDYKTFADVRSSVGSRLVTTLDYWRGIDYRGIQVDGGTPGSNEDINAFYEDLAPMGEQELKKVNRNKEMLNLGVSPLIPYKYKVDYDLGDWVKVVGEYGFESTLVVNEFTRTLDQEGERGFPGLVYVWEI